MIPVFVIHLPNPDRKEKIAAELARSGFNDITYVAAQPPDKAFSMTNMRRNPRAEFGCSLSHLKALNMARMRGYDEPVLIIEDDVVFVDGALEILQIAIERLWTYWVASRVGNWEVLYLGGHPRSPVTQVVDNVYSVGTFSCAEAYVVNPFAIPYILNFWFDRIGQPNAMWDFVLGEYVAKWKTGYAIYPTLTHQPPGWSQIGNKHDDKRELIERGWKANLAA